MKENRIGYIDALRGFVMLLVVFRHVEVFSFGEDVFFTSPFINYFMMPLFFFISGLMAWDNDKTWNASTFNKECKKKCRTLLLPTIFFGLIYTV